jgi:hypothetical protein
MDNSELAAKEISGVYVTCFTLQTPARLKSSDNTSDLQKQSETGNYNVLLSIRDKVFSGILDDRLKEMPVAHQCFK